MAIVNKKARFDYEIEEEVEAGIVLVGSEVKSIRVGKINISDSYAVFRRHELYLINLRIEPYANASHFNHEPERSRKLLLHRKELDRLETKLKLKGYVIVGLKMYFKGSTVKVLLGLGRAKKKYDKREVIKERETKREMNRELKKYSR